MSAQDGAPALGRAPMAPPAQWNARQGSSIPTGSRPARLTRRAMAVTAATLCAPLVAVAGLAAVGAAWGGGDPELGTMAGSQGLRGTTVASSIPATPPVAGSPAPVSKGGDKRRTPTAAAGGRPPTDTTNAATREPATDLRAPTHKPPTTQPRAPLRRVTPTPAPAAPEPIVDPSGPGAPIPGGTTGPGENSGTGSGTGGGSGPSEGGEGTDGGD
jgi:hypothetical protein